MEFVTKLEKTVVGWVKNVPHLPVNAQKWLATNVWWIVLIGAIVSAIAVLFAIGGLFTLIALLGAVSSSVYSYYAVHSITAWAVVSAVVSLVFLAIQGTLLALAINPLKALKKKGWVLLFGAWLVNIVSIVVSAVLSFSVLGFVMGILFGAIGLAVSGYFLFEIHGQFAHTASKKAKK